MLSLTTKTGIANYLTNPARFRTASPWFDDRLLLLEVTPPHLDGRGRLYIIKPNSYERLISDKIASRTPDWIQIMLPATMRAEIVYTPEEHFAAASTCKTLGGEQAAYEYLYSVNIIRSA